MSTPYGGSIYNADDEFINAWSTQGWTAQAPNYKLAPSQGNVNAPTPFPQDLVFVQVTGTWFMDNGDPQPGFLSFAPSTALSYFNSTTSVRCQLSARQQKQYLWYGQLLGWDATAPIQQYGPFKLLATDNNNVVPSRFTYHVKEHWLGGTEYDIIVPKASTSPVDIRTLIVTPSDTTDITAPPINFYSGNSYSYVIAYLDSNNNPITGFNGNLILRNFNNVLMTVAATWNSTNGQFTSVITPTQSTTLASGGVNNYIFQVVSIAGPGNSIYDLSSGQVTVLTPFGGQ